MPHYPDLLHEYVHNNWEDIGSHELQLKAAQGNTRDCQWRIIFQIEKQK